MSYDPSLMSYAQFDKTSSREVVSDLQHPKGKELTPSQTEELKALLARRDMEYTPPKPYRVWRKPNIPRYKFKDFPGYSFLLIPSGLTVHEKLRGALALEFKDGNKPRELITVEQFLAAIGKNHPLAEIVKSNSDKFVPKERFNLLKKK